MCIMCNIRLCSISTYVHYLVEYIVICRFACLRGIDILSLKEMVHDSASFLLSVNCSYVIDSDNFFSDECLCYTSDQIDLVVVLWMVKWWSPTTPVLNYAGIYTVHVSQVVHGSIWTMGVHMQLFQGCSVDPSPLFPSIYIAILKSTCWNNNVSKIAPGIYHLKRPKLKNFLKGDVWFHTITLSPFQRGWPCPC